VFEFFLFSLNVPRSSILSWRAGDSWPRIPTQFTTIFAPRAFEWFRITFQIGPVLRSLVQNRGP